MASSPVSSPIGSGGVPTPGAAPEASGPPATVVPEQPVVVHSDMPEAARAVCFAAAAAALAKYRVDKDHASHIKRALEAWNGALWHVVVGASFGASVAHDNHSLVLFRIGRTFFLCFQTFDDGSLINSTKKPEHVSRTLQDGKEGDAAAGKEEE